jgi:glycine/D-amino acid oxidase-like deaminating enzyme
VSAPVPAECDALIIGGGVIGMSIAWRAAQQGLSVVIADPRPGLGATHAAAGMLTPIAEAAYAEREIFALGQESLRRYPDFISDLQDVTGLPTGFRDAAGRIRQRRPGAAGRDPGTAGILRGAPGATQRA